MTCYLLLPALISGMVALQIGNATSGLSDREVGTLSENNTFHNGILKPPNATSASYAEDLNRLEGELEQLSNGQVNVTTEDNENFQDQQDYYTNMSCDAQLVAYSHLLCGKTFHKEMSTISAENWCSLKDTIGPYNDMTLCLESLCAGLRCYYPNPTVQDFFVSVHSQYFGNCSEVEMLPDAPQGVVVVLTLVPVSLIPVLVFLVVWKSNVRE